MLILKAKQLAAVSFIAHLVLSVGIAMQMGTVGRNPVWGYFPDWLWPMIFFVMALLSLAGIFNVIWLKFSLYMGAMIMLVWSAVTLYHSLISGQLQPTIPWLFWIGFLQYMIAEYAFALQTLKEKTEQIVQEVKNASGR